MKLSLFTIVTMAVALVTSIILPVPRDISTVITNSTKNCTTAPVNYGVILFRTLDMLDIFGPLDILQLAAKNHTLNLHLIAATLDPVTTEPSNPAMNVRNSSFWPVLQPTNTFDDNLDLDVLIIPGGAGVRAPGLDHIVDYVRDTYPKVKYLITICTGASFAAKAGVLDGKRATTNKAAWGTITPMGPKVDWVAPARYVVDGNIWTSSGVASGLDLTFAFVKQVYGEPLANRIANIMEHAPYAADWDPFTDIHGVEPSNN
ncbi:Isonitrile hydratase 3 [Colletotrichum chlorophyti]|uniref:Isonitrile hydratase 3 n=1 Tax=Colletotrichum chlorophyti TaxID=708187 RepID=A0A1Q8RXU2_9PEZI|nr:Isonitrile hydratase 3 [Colletotrichum chlorophyti]